MIYNKSQNYVCKIGGGSLRFVKSPQLKRYAQKSSIMKDLSELPDNLPIPVDDGACSHLQGTQIPSIALKSTSDKNINVGTIKGVVVMFFYPMNGRPDAPPMIGWNDIPGARGCTPQSNSYKGNILKLEKLELKVFGISSQPLLDQKEAKFRLDLPFDLLNDSDFTLTKAMQLPTFKYQESTYIKRLTIIAENGIIKKTFYPVFPPNENVLDVLNWAKHNNAFKRDAEKTPRPLT